MAQGMIPGGTNYEHQTLEAIKKDIEYWIEYGEEVKILFTESISKLKNNEYWNKIPYNFQGMVMLTLTYTNTFESDANIIIAAIDSDNLSKREVKLLKQLGDNAIKYNDDYSTTYKDENNWKDYSNKDFRIAEKLYQEGRDYVATLMDAQNASFRLKDYIIEGGKIVSKNEVKIEAKKLKFRDLNQGNISSESKRKFSWVYHVIIPLAVATIAGVLIYIITN